MTAVVVDDFEIISKIHLPNYEIMIVPGDGHCMYRSILQCSKWLGVRPGSEYDDTDQGIIGARGFRNKVANIIRDNKSMETDLGRSYARKLKSEMIKSVKSNEWGTDAIASMISNYYNIPIAIIDKHNNDVVNGVDDLTGIILYYNSTRGNEHYDWLRKKDEASLKF